MPVLREKDAHPAMALAMSLCYTSGDHILQTKPGNTMFHAHKCFYGKTEYFTVALSLKPQDLASP